MKFKKGDIVVVVGCSVGLDVENKNWVYARFLEKSGYLGIGRVIGPSPPSFGNYLVEPILVGRKMDIYWNFNEKDLIKIS